MPKKPSKVEFDMVITEAKIEFDTVIPEVKI